jgi:outer membrane lipoprotein SlyB
MRVHSASAALAAYAVLACAGAALAQSSGVAPAPCGTCGVVQSVAMSTQEEAWTPLGVVGSMPATASGTSMQARSMFALDGQARPELVVVGAAGGAVYAKRPTSYQRPRWDVSVKLDTGGTRVVTQRYEPFVREGDHVRIMGTQLEPVE